MNTIPLVESVTPSANDMIFPLSVMKVIPTATQPMKDVVFNSENRLTVVKKPGVANAAATSASNAAKRIATSTRARAPNAALAGASTRGNADGKDSSVMACS